MSNIANEEKLALSYEAAAVLCRVEGMPIDETRTSPPDGSTQTFTRIGGCQMLVDHRDSHRLTPLAPLTDKQAAICIAMGCQVEEWYDAGDGYLHWYRIDPSVDPDVVVYGGEKFRVPSP